MKSNGSFRLYRKLITADDHHRFPHIKEMDTHLVMLSIKIGNNIFESRPMPIRPSLLTNSILKMKMEIEEVLNIENKGIEKNTGDLEWKSIYSNIEPSQEIIEKHERAFNARLAYEKNCIAKYDYPDWMMKPSRPIPKGETMADFARRYGVTIQEMEQAVERALKNGL